MKHLLLSDFEFNSLTVNIFFKPVVCDLYVNDSELLMVLPLH